MSHHVASFKPLFLSEEEALALLDMCLMSATENDPTKVRAMLKLSDLVRRYLATEEDACEEPEREVTEAATEPEQETIPVTSLLHRLSEAAIVPEKTVELDMRQHTGRVYFGRRDRYLKTLFFTD